MASEQKEDVEKIFEGWKSIGNLDYVSCWYKKAADYIVPLAGKAYLYSEQNVTLKKGDIIIPDNYGDGVPDDKKNKKVYVLEESYL